MFDFKHERFRTEVVAVHREDKNVRRLFRVKIIVVIVKQRGLSCRLSENNIKFE